MDSRCSGNKYLFLEHFSQLLFLSSLGKLLLIFGFSLIKQGKEENSILDLPEAGQINE